MIEKTNCLTFCCHGFQDGRACPVCKGVPQFSDNAATVTRTCESLVGEKGQMNREASAYAKYVGLDAKPTAVDEPELQLLVIDMGDCCVVRVEQGEIDLPPYLSSHTAHDDGVPVVVDVPFTELRSAIDGEKPVPRIESESGGGHELHFLGANDVPCTTYIGGNAQKALESLFGKPLPIYEGGKWEDLHPKTGLGWEMPVGIWRFTR